MSVDKSVRIFNKFFSGFLRDLKEIDEGLRSAVKSSYSVIDKTSSEYRDFFEQNIGSKREQLLNKEFDNDDVATLEVCKGISLGAILKACTEEAKKTTVLNYLYILVLFSYVAEKHDDVLLEQVVELLSFVQNNDEESFEKEADVIVDDEVLAILNRIKEYGGKTRVHAEAASSETSSDTSGVGAGSFFERLNNSKIADIAKEISKDIDVSTLKADNPDDILKNLFNPGSGDNNVLGNIIQKVSTTLNDKFSSGELKHEDLLGEAMSMMNLFGGAGGMANNPMFAQMAKAMKQGKTNIRQDVIKKASARDRLRKKLEERKQTTSSE